jgi:tetratricopeptide (TPR) repeat protein
MNNHSVSLRRAARAVMMFLIPLVLVAQNGGDSLTSVESMIRSRQYEQALETTHSMLSRSPRDHHLWALQGIVLSLQGQDKQALAAFDRALALSPHYAAALKGEAQLYYGAQDKRAIEILEKILAEDPEDLTAQEMLAMSQEQQGNCKSAIVHFAASLETAAKHGPSLEAYGKCLAQEGQPAKAITVFEQLAALLPDRSYPQYDVGLLLIQTSQYGAAVKLLVPLSATHPADPEILSLASEACEGAGDTPRAVSLLREAIVLDPMNASYYSRFAALSLNHESFQVGIDMATAGLARLPNEPSLYVSRGLLYAQLAEYDRAEADFKRAEQLDQKQSLPAYALVLSQMQRNNPSAAIAQVRSQLQVHPQSALLHSLLARLLFDQGPETNAASSSEALKAALTAIRLKPDLLEARDLLANIYLRSGNYKVAAEQCRRALQYDASDQVAIYHLIVALRHTNAPGAGDEIKTLVKRLADLQTSARQQELERKRFKLVESDSPAKP